MNIVEKVAQSKAVILKMYLDESDTRDWAVAYSGGKDSTAVMGLVVSVLESLPPEKRTRNIHAVMSNTLAENPLVHEHMVKQMGLINKYAKEKELPIKVDMVHRPLEQSFFYLTLGRGYFLPLNSGKGRWCTDRLKIKPQVTLLKEINPSYTLTGVRKAESTSRAKSIEKFQIEEFIGTTDNYENSFTIMPIVNWTVEDVWRYLEMEGLSWGSTLSVRAIYRDATGECGFTNPTGVDQKSVEVCGARHGCWMCPVIMKDKSTEKMSEKHEWLEPLTEWRTTLLRVYGTVSSFRTEKKVRSAKVKCITKSGYKRSGKKLEEGQGALTIEARKYLLNTLLETESYMNRIRQMYNLPPERLISDEEVSLIRKQWEDDAKDHPFMIGEKIDSILEYIEE